MRYIGSALCFLVGAVILLLVCYPQAIIWVVDPMRGVPRRYHYYFFEPAPPSNRLLGAVFGAALLALGFVLVLRGANKDRST